MSLAPIRGDRLLGPGQYQGTSEAWGERTFSAGCNRYQRNGEPFGIVEQIRQFHGFSGPGKREDDILIRDHTQVAMTGFGRVNKI